MLLHHAADPNVAGKGGLTPLMCATLAEEKEITHLQIGQSCDIEASRVRVKAEGTLVEGRYELLFAALEEEE